MFLIAVASLIVVIGTLLWYTNWAEARLIQGEPKASSAKSR